MPARPSAGRVSARRRRRSVGRRFPLLGFVTFVALLAGATAGVIALLDGPAEEPRILRCAASLEGTDWYLEPDQADTAALLAGMALARDLPARALTIAIATGLQESRLRNLDHGDRDSLGIFQQRPSQGWGTEEQLMDPVYAAGAFYDALVRVDGYQGMTVTQAAQAVQRSAFPEAYAEHEARARAWASAMYGYTGGAVWCTLAAPDGPGDPEHLVARVQRDFPEVAATVTDEGVLLDVAPLAGASPDSERLGWAVAHWAVLVADALRVDEVAHAGSVWDRESGIWAGRETDYPAGTVLVVLAG